MKAIELPELIDPLDGDTLSHLGATYAHVERLLDHHAAITERTRGGHGQVLLQAHSSVGSTLTQSRKHAEALAEQAAVDGGRLALRAALGELRKPVQDLQEGLSKIERLLDG